MGNACAEPDPPSWGNRGVNRLRRVERELGDGSVEGSQVALLLRHPCRRGPPVLRSPCPVRCWHHSQVPSWLLSPSGRRWPFPRSACSVGPCPCQGLSPLTLRCGNRTDGWRPSHF
jgi:hypothetical protein